MGPTRAARAATPPHPTTRHRAFPFIIPGGQRVELPRTPRKVCCVWQQLPSSASQWLKVAGSGSDGDVHSWEPVGTTQRTSIELRLYYILITCVKFDERKNRPIELSTWFRCPVSSSSPSRLLFIAESDPADLS